MRQHRTPKLAFKSNHHLSDNWKPFFSTDKQDAINAGLLTLTSSKKPTRCWQPWRPPWFVFHLRLQIPDVCKHQCSPAEETEGRIVRLTSELLCWLSNTNFIFEQAQPMKLVAQSVSDDETFNSDQVLLMREWGQGEVSDSVEKQDY